MSKTKVDYWFATYDNITALGAWLIESAQIVEVKDLQYFYEKPWKWDKEWEKYQMELEKQ